VGAGEGPLLAVFVFEAAGGLVRLAAIDDWCGAADFNVMAGTK